MLKDVTPRRNGEPLGAGPSNTTDRVDRADRAASDKGYIVGAGEGSLLTPFDPQWARVMEAEERISKQYPNALSELAQ